MAGPRAITKLDYSFAADALAAKAGVNGPILSALINAESSWNPDAVSPTGAMGLGQFIMSTGADYGLVGPGYDHRTDAALNLTAMVMYLADLRAANPTWRSVIGHYSGQGESLSTYATYSAGQALIAVIDSVDGTTPAPLPPPAPPPTPAGDTYVGTLQDSTGKSLQVSVTTVGTLAAMMLAVAVMMARPTPAGPVASAPIPQQVSVASNACTPGDLRRLLNPSPCR